jgi:hypothetical protein
MAKDSFKLSILTEFPCLSSPSLILIYSSAPMNLFNPKSTIKIWLSEWFETRMFSGFKS